MFSIIAIEDGVKGKGSRTWGIHGFTWTHTLSERSFSSPDQEAVGVPYIVVCLLACYDIWATLQAVFSLTVVCVTRHFKFRSFELS
jgi:hypothetical protein